MDLVDVTLGGTYAPENVEVGRTRPLATGSPSARQRDALGRLPMVALGVACGVLIVALGYARGRADQPWSAPLYWLGESVVFLVPALLVLGRRTVTSVEAFGVALIFATATFAIKLCYSPLQFTFLDEFQHLPTIQTILSTHHLFHSNPNLNVSPYYPGMEIVTSAVVTLSHLSTYASAAIVLGLARLITTVAFFYLTLEIIPIPRIAAIAVCIYATGPDYQFFSSYFAYESLALALAMLSLLAFVKMLKSPAGGAVFWGFISIGFGIATAVTHHLTSYVLFALELCLVAFQLPLKGRVLRQRSFIPVAIITGGFIAVWALAIATPTYSYLQSGLSRLLIHGQPFSDPSAAILPTKGGPILTDKVASTVAPNFDRVVAYTWATLLTVLVLIGLWRLWKTRRTQSALLLAMGVAAPIVFVAFFIQIVSPGGGEAATRLFSFALIPGAIICAFSINTLIAFDASRTRQRHMRRHRPAARAFRIGVAGLLALGAIAVSWPPFYARIPGPYLVGGGSRSIDEYNIAAAQWAGSDLTSGNVFSADSANSELMSSVGRQTAGNAYVASLLIIGSRVTPAVAKRLKKEGADLVIADHRITTSIPVAGNGIFDDDAFGGHYRRPIPSSSLDKFNSLAGVSRIFDDGPIVIYDLEGSAYSKPVHP